MHGCTDFRWQKSFHDRIIRNERELSAAREYIINNPVNEPQNPARY
jgi:hypothetical protein